MLEKEELAKAQRLKTFIDLTHFVKDDTQASGLRLIRPQLFYSLDRPSRPSTQILQQVYQAL